MILGGGIIALAAAFELSGRGAEVCVIDSAEPGRAASWAAAGMLAPWSEQHADSVLQQLCAESLALYPAFAQRIREASGVDPQLRLDGILNVAFEESSLKRLEQRAAELRANAISAQMLSREDLLLVEPALGAHVCGALLVPGEGQIDNRRLVRALLEACARRGVRVESGVRDLRIECDTRRALGVRTGRGFTAAEAVVNAAGAWSAQVEGIDERYAVPVRPVKGQMLAIEVPRGFMRRATWVPGAYLVPRSDGRLLVGATVEEAGYDTRTTASGMQQLLAAALHAAPALSNFSVSETWAGLRPATPSGRPVIGATALDGYYVATGHYRNGILLAPVTAGLLADAIEGKAGALEAFAPPRCIVRP